MEDTNFNHMNLGTLYIFHVPSHWLSIKGKIQQFFVENLDFIIDIQCAERLLAIVCIS